QVELQPVGFINPQQARTEIVVGVQEPAEVFIEELNAGHRRGKVIVRRQVAEVVLAEEFLEGDVRVETVSAFARIDLRRKVFLRGDVVEIKDRRNLDRPFLRL